MNRATGLSWEGKKPPPRDTGRKTGQLASLKQKVTEAGTTNRTGKPSVRQVRNEILEKTWEATEGESRTLLAQAIQHCADTMDLFTSDDVLQQMPSGWRPVNLNSIGAAFATASKAGIITKTGYRPTERLTSHGRDIAVWTKAH